MTGNHFIITSLIRSDNYWIQNAILTDTIYQHIHSFIVQNLKWMIRKRMDSHNFYFLSTGDLRYSQ